MLDATVRADLPRPAHVALNAISREDGVNRLWALAFAPGKAEFHAPECRVLAVAA